MIVTNPAVPATPAPCCTGLSTAEPCPYKWRDSAPSDTVNSGGKVKGKPRLSTTCAMSTAHQGVAGVNCV